MATICIDDLKKLSRSVSQLQRLSLNVYLSSPYSHPSKKVRYLRFVEACRAAGWLISQGKSVFCPIAHTHPMSIHSKKASKFSAATWLLADTPFLVAAEEMYILEIDGWRESVGVSFEVDVAMTLNKPISLLAKRESARGISYVVTEFDLSMLRQ